MPDQGRTNIHQLDVFCADDLVVEISGLRTRLISAWRERAVMLTPEEQKRLRQEIKDTCALLTELTN
jgi:hypothetical protein